MGTDVIVHPDSTVLAEAVAARLLLNLVDAQAAHGEANVVLTGGRVAAAVYRAVAASPVRQAVDWSRVSLWWGDARFRPSGHPDRNETQARAALAGLPLPEERIHPMPAADGPDGDDPEAAAARYARTLSEHATSGPLPRFDVLLLGVGEDGHVASLFPGLPGVSATGIVCPVRDSPKPPPVRLSLTLPTINTAAQVWLVAAGPDKAKAVGQARSGADLPAARVRGTDATLWLLDRAAADVAAAASR